LSLDLLPLLLTALALGLLGGGHCIGMCGGLMGALSLAIPAQERRGWRLWKILLGYNAGRLFSYTLAGALFGSLGWLIRDLGLDAVLRVIAGLLMIAMGLYLANWWSGLTRIERLGAGLWKKLQPYTRKLMPVSRVPQAFALGSLWGWLPCGLVYSTLIWAGSQGGTLLSAALMLAFGLGTLPTLLATGVAARKLMEILRRRSVRLVAALMVMLFGLWTLALPYLHLMRHATDH
jgi:uncharacterized protein